MQVSYPLGVFFKFSSSDTDENYTKYQEKVFGNKRVDNGRNSNIKYKHLLNSFGSLKCKDSAYDFIRVGIILYGA